MNIFTKFNFLSEKNTSFEDFQSLEQMSKKITSENKEAIGRQLGDLFIEKSEQLIGELIIHPEQALIYESLGQRLKSIDEGLSRSFQSTIDSIQSIAGMLRDGNEVGLNTYTQHMSTQLIDSPFFHTTTSDFYALHLPEDIEKVRAIPNPDVRTRIMAQLINRDKTPISALNLSKSEIKSLAPHLTFLDCGNDLSKWWGPEFTMFLKKCVNLKTLIIHSPLISSLPPLPHCETLDCSRCINLKSLPDELPKCQTLKCSNCSFSKKTPELPSCRVLECQNCDIRLPDELPLCEMLDCSNCNITSLPNLPNCYVINCSTNRRLNLIGMVFPKCRTFICDSCWGLSSLPLLPNCQFLRCSDCYFLRTETIPPRFRSVNEQSEIMQVSVDGININPLNVLLDLSPLLLIGHDLPPIQFLETNGILTPVDLAPGPKKNLITRLMDSLALHGNESDQLSFVEDEFGQMPVFRSDVQLDESKSERHRIGFQTLGAIFIQCLKHGYLTGNVFNPALFKMISSLSYQDLASLENEPTDLPEELRLKLALVGFGDSIPFKNLLLQKPNHLQLTDQEYAKLRDEVLGIKMETVEEIREKEGIDLSEATQTNKKWIYGKAYEFCQEFQKNQLENQGDIVLPAVLIAKQMQLLCNGEQQWNVLMEQGANELQNKVEGILTQDLFLRALEWERTLNVNEEQHKKIANFLSSFINGFTSDGQVDPMLGRERLANLIFTITSSRTLANNSRIKFHLCDREPNRMPNVHTCFSIIEISANCPDYETFEKNMNILIEQSIEKKHSGFVM